MFEAVARQRGQDGKPAIGIAHDTGAIGIGEAFADRLASPFSRMGWCAEALGMSSGRQSHSSLSRAVVRALHSGVPVSQVADASSVKCTTGAFALPPETEKLLLGGELCEWQRIYSPLDNFTLGNLRHAQ